MTSALVLMAITGLAWESSASAQDSTNSNSTIPPVPPEQARPWTPPPTKLPPVVVSAITELFNDGLADPRGCEYREIEVAWGEGTIKTHGWVLPGNGSERFAVGWDGLVYPLKSIGKPASLEDDFPGKRPQEGFQGLDNNWPASENWSLSTDSLIPLKAALLLRLGHADLAENIWKRGFAHHPEIAAADPYVLMANPWLSALYQRVVGAHCEGSDALALQTCRFLLPLQQRAEASASKRGITKPAKDNLYFEELAQLPELAADQERRAQEPPYIPVLQSGLPAQGPERIAALIRDLELVSARQEMNPGQTEVIDDPIVQALIQEGEPAVEPLITCLEKDNRLTRSLYTYHLLGRGPMIPVYEPAYVALGKILKITMPLPEGRSPRDLSSDDRKALAQQFRDYWSKYHALSPPERWYDTLRNDNAGATAWFDAAADIVQPIDDKAVPITRQGDALRSKSNPSVSELIIERFNQIIAQTGADENSYFDHLSNLLFALADWDGKAHFDDLRAMTAKLVAKWPHHYDGFYSTIQTTVTVYEKRVALGDPTALSEYAAWLTTLDPNETEPPTFKLMWQNPSEPVIQKAAAALFAGKDSPWRLVPPQPPRFACDLVSTPLIGLPVFRQSLLNALEDTTVVGGLYVNEEGTLLDGKVRFCDYAALRLSDVEEFPEMKFDGPAKQRNAVVERCKMLLQRYGDRYRYGPQDENQNPEPARSGHTAIAFAPLDHPATPEDVTRGRAIFSLPGTTRICAMPPFPIPAQRPSSPEDPVRWSGDNGITYTYDTWGMIWQAEEVQVDGKWQRYYGFAGRHQLEKVPASQIVFPRGYGDAAINDSIDARLDGPEFKTFNPVFAQPYSYTTLGSPLPFTVKARNHSSFDQSLPDILTPAANGDKVLPPAISFSLSYSEKIPPEVLNPTAIHPQFEGLAAFAAYHPFDYGSWQEVPLQKNVQVMATAQTSSVILAPTQELPVLKIDLRDYFDMSRPGTYRLTALFHVPGQPVNKSNEITFSVADPSTSSG